MVSDVRELIGACVALFSVKLNTPPPKKKHTKPAFYSTQEWMSAKTRVYTRDGKVCSRCFGIERLNIDHIIPRSKVPSMALDDINLRVLCWPCNSAKNTRVEVDYVLL